VARHGFGLLRASVAGLPGRVRVGFTLIEILVTLVILSVGIVAILHAFQSSLTALGAAGDSLRAELAIREKMAEIEQAARDGNESAMASSREVFTSGFYRGFQRQCLLERLATSRAEGKQEITLFQVQVDVEKSASRTRRSAVTYITLTTAEGA
jgi:prepilin-type N-terminal cleavage/methylation domain-containing protein